MASNVIFKKTYPNGKVTYDKQTGNAIFTPNNVTSDTPVYIYYTGAIGNANYYPGYLAAPEAIANKYFEDPNFNGIVVINNYENDSIYADNYVKNSVNDNRRIVDNLENLYGVELNNRHVFGSSVGDRFALHDFASEVRNGTDNGFCVITGASVINAKQGFDYNSRIQGGEDPNRAFLSKEDYNAISGKTVLAFESGNGHNYTYVNALAENGVNVFLVECSDGGHNNLSLKPLQDNIFDVLAGDEDAILKFMQNGNYHFKKCVDAKNHKWVDATYEEVKEALLQSMLTNGEYAIKHNLADLDGKINGLKDGLGKYNSNLNSDEIKSDDDYVKNKVNAIFTAIGETNLLNSRNSVSVSSTTKVPPAAIDILYDYSSSVINLLDKLKTECNAAVAICEHINDTDWLMKHQAEMAFNKKDEVPSDGGNNTYNGPSGSNQSSGGSKKNGANSNTSPTPADNNTDTENNASNNNQDTDTPVNETPNTDQPVDIANEQPVNNEATTEPVNNNVSPQPAANTAPVQETPVEEIPEEEVETDIEDELLPDDIISDNEYEDDIDLVDDSVNNEMETDIDTDLEPEELPEETTENESGKRSANGIGLAIGALAAGAAGYGAYKGIKKLKEDQEKENEASDEFNDFDNSDNTNQL